MIITIAAFAEDIRDIKPPVSFPVNYVFLIILVSILSLIICVFLGGYIYRRLREKKSLSMPPRKTPSEIAYEALENLKARDLPATGKVREYYFELSNIVRRYIEDKFSIKAPEMTTEEFLSSLKESDTLSDSHKNLLKDFLNLCDIVKFARYGPDKKEIDQSFNAAKKIVDET